MAIAYLVCNFKKRLRTSNLSCNIPEREKDLTSTDIIYVLSTSHAYEEISPEGYHLLC